MQRRSDRRTYQQLNVIHPTACPEFVKTDRDNNNNRMIVSVKQYVEMLVGLLTFMQ